MNFPEMTLIKNISSWLNCPIHSKIFKTSMSLKRFKRDVGSFIVPISFIFPNLTFKIITAFSCSLSFSNNNHSLKEIRLI